MVDPGARKSIIDALQSWDRDATAQRLATSEQIRSRFVERFPMPSWPELPLDDYALGQGSQDTVCYWMEFTTGLIPSMKGGSAYKHLIFRGRDGTWRFPPEYRSVEQAWDAIRNGFVAMLDAAHGDRFDDIDDIKVLYGASALRTKLLCMYFPDDLIAVTSKADIDHYLRSLDEQTPPDPSVVRANRQLLNALRTISELSELSSQELGLFLYHWNNPRPSQRIVKIAPGEAAKYWGDCLDGSYICVGWDEVGDLSQYETKDDFRDAFRNAYPYNGVERQVSRKANELWTLRELQPGDRVIANRGTAHVVGLGTVTDDAYQWRPERDEYKHTVGIDWDTSVEGPIEPVKAWATTTVSKVPATLYRQIFGTAPTEKPAETDQIYLDLEAALKRRGQVILYGPPGTGKTYIARRAAVWLLDGGSANPNANALLADKDDLLRREQELSHVAADHGKAARLTQVTFHPSYTYEDFIEGYRPRKSTSGIIQLELADGLFKRVCDTARRDPHNSYLVLIDEINRGNIPKILGELITLIEKEKRGMTLQLPQSGKAFSVPENVRILGTMNTADRSIHLLDTALRRRFQFVELLPDSSLLEGQTVGALALGAFLDSLNDAIRDKFGRDKQIGHSIFFQDGKVIDTPDAFAAVFRYELLPLLQEYLYDDYAALGDLLGSVIDGKNQRTTESANDPEILCEILAAKFSSSASA